MYGLSVLCTGVTGCFASAAIAASVPVLARHSRKDASFSLSLTALDLLNMTGYTTPWPQVPWTYQIPGPTPQDLKFEEISSEDPGVEGQQSTLHACDEVIRWLWQTYNKGQNVDHAVVQTSDFNGKIQGHVIMVFVPATGTSGVIGRELALDGVRSLETLVWRYGGRSLECEIWAGGKVKGRISITIKVSKANSAVGSGAEGATGLDSS